MSPFFPFWILIALLPLVSEASAQSPQERGQEVTITENVRVAVPPHWRLSNQTRESVQFYVPLAKDRPRTQDQPQPQSPKQSGDPDVKPLYLALYEAGLLVTIERRRDHAEAVRRLAEIASEQAQSSTLLVIAGWPAIERRYRALLPQLGGVFGTRGNVETMYGTTAIAVGTTVFRFETMLAPDADTKLLDESLAIARALRAPAGPAAVSERELNDIRRLVKPPGSTPQPSPPAPGAGQKRSGTADKQPGIAVQARTGRGELEIVTDGAQNVLIAANSGRALSNNFGVTYNPAGGPPCTAGFLCNGDPSLAIGASGAMYYAWIEGATNTTLGDAVARSIDNGQIFTLQGRAAVCPGTTMCSVADQEHIAADRVNPAIGGGDRLYNVWRDFGAPFSIRISCSVDSGVNWTGGVAIGAGDFPRVSVGGDGFVYVTWASGGNMMLHKYSDCDAGLAPQVGWPITVSAFSNVVCPVPGLDRCNGRNILSSPKVAVDDLDPNHLYYVFATSTGAGNENVMVFDSVDGGATFPRSVVVNGAAAARRFMPWVATYGGVAVVTWYDRRTATAANNDLTRFYIGGAAVRGPNLQALAEVDISGADDAQCSTWPCATNAVTDSESCSIQPQLGGRCRLPGGGGSATPCDFSTTVCPVGETCQIGRGCPKYGDYNGNAAGAGILYSAWASATPPASVGGPPGAINIYASADRIPSDFYVRDWNTSAAVFDNGAQPSTHANFWSTSDVWNQSTNIAAAPGPSGWVVGDPPSRSGSNFAYARVSRRAPAMATAPDAPVTVNFLYGDFGLGSPYVALGSETVTFAAGDMTQVTPAHSWIVPASASQHLCLAVEIEAPDGDVFAPPSMVGTAPGPASGSMILADNNKAQRNLQDTVGTAGGTETIALIRNQELISRLLRLRIKLPPGVKVPGSVEVVGGRTFALADNGVVELGRLAPGERRWVRFRLTSFAGLEKPVALDVFDDTRPPVNGFTLLLRRTSLENVARRTLLGFAGVMTRLAQVESSASAKELAQYALRAAKNVSMSSYADYLAANGAAIRRMVEAHLKWAKGADPFEIGSAAKELSREIDLKDIERAAAVQAAVTERLDAHLTMLLRARGTTDDILHNVRWQRALFVKLANAASAAEIVKEADGFLEANGGPSDFPKLLDVSAQALDRATASLGAKGASARKALAALHRGEKSGASAPTLQKLHRDFLLEVNRLAE